MGIHSLGRLSSGVFSPSLHVHYLSPVVANLFMEAFEERALESATLKPRLWVRYVDDTFVLWPHGEHELEKFHLHLNKQHQSSWTPSGLHSSRYDIMNGMQKTSLF